MATAVKHSAEKVSVAIDNPFTRAVFTFEDSPTSSVDISVSTSSFLSGLLRRGQITYRKENSFEGQLEINVAKSLYIELRYGDAGNGGLEVFVKKRY